jgi:hypothetical protein
MGAFGIPLPRQQLRELGLWRVGDAGEDVGEAGLRVNVIELGGLDERVHEGGSLCPALRSRKQP